ASCQRLQVQVHRRKRHANRPDAWLAGSRRRDVRRRQYPHGLGLGGSGWVAGHSPSSAHHLTALV
ncbi:hypothetical protein PHISCL_11163, partial [Aspergillus sclerotialis]